MNRIWVGTSGYNYRDWRGDFYPKDTPVKDWLSYYSTKFKTVEINATFYGSFKEATYAKWADQVPPDFIFTIKGPRFITHIQRIKNPESSIKRFFAAAKGLGDKLGVVLWQFAPNFHNNGENFARLGDFLIKLPKETPQVFEFRHESWFDGKIYDLLDRAQAGIVISQNSYFPSEEVVVGGICYIRFHGPTSLYSSPYSTKQLKDWAIKIRKWAKNNEVYCYFNNDAGGYAFRNATELSTILGV